MSRCRNCKYLGWGEEYPGKPFFGWCEEINDNPDIDVERECRCFKPTINADIIRRMSDEELAQFIFELYEQPLKDGYLQWLQQPVEEP